MARAGKGQQHGSGLEGVAGGRGEEAEVRGDCRGLGSCAREDKKRNRVGVGWGRRELLGRQGWQTQLVTPEAEPLGCHRGQWEGH